MNIDLITYPILLIVGAILIIGLVVFIIRVYRLYKQYKKLCMDYEKLYERYVNVDKKHKKLLSIIYNDEILNHFKPIIRRGTINEEVVTFAEFRYDLETKKATLYVRRRSPKTNKLEPVRANLRFQKYKID